MEFAAEGPKATLREVAEKTKEAAGNGSAAIDEGKQGITLIIRGLEHLSNSKVHSLQEIENLLDVLRLLNTLFEGYMTQEVADIISTFTKARDQVETYSNDMSRSVQELNLMIAQMARQLGDMSRSGSTFLQASHRLAEFGESL